VAWLWWLLAPVATTSAGALLLWWRAWSAPSGRRLPAARAMAAHRAMLAALPGSAPDDPIPVTLRLLDVEPDRGHAPAAGDRIAPHDRIGLPRHGS
jgi:hypothetical protein